MGLVKQAVRPSLKLPPLRLYLSDIEDLHKALAEQCTEISYEGAGYDATEPSDLEALSAKHGRKMLKQLRITAEHKSGGRITIELGGHWFFSSRAVSVLVGDDEAWGFAGKIKAMLEEKRRFFLSRVLSLDFPGSSWVPAVLIPVLGWLLSDYFVTLIPNEMVIAAVLGFGVAALVAIGVSFVASLFSGTRIHLKRRGEHESLFEWADTKSVIISVVSALAGAVALMALQKLIGWSLN